MDESTSGGLRILILDDDEYVVRAMTRTLRIDGHEVVGVTTAAEAMSTGERFDLALLDLELPGALGTEVGKALLASGDVRHVLFFSGTLNPTLRAQAEAIAPVFFKADLDALRETIRAGNLSAEAGAAGAAVLGLAPDSDSADD